MTNQPKSSFLTALKAKIAVRKKRAQRGNVAVLFGLTAVPLALGVGLAIDGGRAKLTQSKLQWSLDNAALAIGANGLEGENARLMAQKFVNANMRTALAPANAIPAPTITRETVTFNASADVPTTLMALTGMNSMGIDADVEVKRQISAMMVSLVLDNTGSMWTNDNIGSLRTASLGLTNYLFGGQANAPDLRIAVVPYSAAVNVGGAAGSIVEPHSLGAPNQSGALAWKGCVFERAGTNSLADTPPVNDGDGSKWTPYRWMPSTDNNWTDGSASTVDAGPRNDNGLRGPNLGCPTPILPLTGVKADVDAALNGMSAWNRGGTMTDIGIAWGLRVLSPGEPFSQSAQVDPMTGQAIWSSSRWARAMVIMTDGESQAFDLGGSAGSNATHSSASDVTGYGRVDSGLATSILGTFSNHTNTRALLQTRIESLCTRAKNDGIVVYTVVFTSGVSQAIRDSYRACASDPGKYWYAPTGTELNAAFGQIGRDLTQLRVSQ